MLFLVNYEDSREQFKVIKILELNNSGIVRENVKQWNFDKIKEWFKFLNDIAIKS